MRTPAVLAERPAWQRGSHQMFCFRGVSLLVRAEAVVNHQKTNNDLHFTARSRRLFIIRFQARQYARRQEQDKSKRRQQRRRQVLLKLSGQQAWRVDEPASIPGKGMMMPG